MFQKWYSRGKAREEAFTGGIVSAMDDIEKLRPQLFDELREEVLASGVASEGQVVRIDAHGREPEPSVSQRDGVPRQGSGRGNRAEVSRRRVEETLAPPQKNPAPAIKLQGRVLAVEDAPDIQRLVRLFLTSAGLEVTLATNGQNAIEAALHHAEAGQAFDVILMDMQMPVLDGYRATELLRAAGYSGTIVALTGHALTGERERCLAAGCDDYLVKPINRTTLLTALTRYLSARSSGPTDLK